MKAKELVDSFRTYAYSYEVILSEEDTEDWNAKQCALVCVDEMYGVLYDIHEMLGIECTPDYIYSKMDEMIDLKIAIKDL